MIPKLRDQFNKQVFSPERYRRMQEIAEQSYGYKPDFRLAETPLFISNDLRNKILSACEDVVSVLCKSDFKEKTEAPLHDNNVWVPNEGEHTTFLQMDFAICTDEIGTLEPQLIEVQGFPTLYFFQELLAKAYRKAYDLPEHFSSRFHQLTVADYFEKLKQTIVGDTAPEQVVMLEIEPEKQHTYIDFLATHKELGIKVLCISKLKKRAKALYYLDEAGRAVPVKRIYNRVIFDELLKRNDLNRAFSFQDELAVEWVGHPNWFYRISKYMLPLIDSPYSPKSFYLHLLDSYPEDLENYVLKPLFSFAGEGVKLHVSRKELDAIKDRKNYILQKKVAYAPALKTPTGKAKCEIRILLLWEKGQKHPTALNNMVRITKGEMVG
ncbi:MAG TPA: hypothetical protein ENJ45_01085, partial [Phaeodactylibacter sp.]|nr:hypothetical protein [Phaeodactylibacter sp.]